MPTLAAIPQAADAVGAALPEHEKRVAASIRFCGIPITETGAFPPARTSACWVYVTLNSEISLSFAGNTGLQQLLGQSRTRVSVDGQWVLWGLQRKYAGCALRKLSGSDLIFEIARHCALRGQRLMLIGSSAPANAAAMRALELHAPGLAVQGFAPAVYASASAGEQGSQRQILAAIQAARPDFVVLGLGAMKEHRLAAALAPALDGQVTGLLCFGGAIDMAGGAYRRAPRAWQVSGLEGLYRVWQQPRRLWRLIRVLRILPLLAAGRY